jgi:glutamyl-tRNA synthetase
LNLFLLGCEFTKKMSSNRKNVCIFATNNNHKYNNVMSERKVRVRFAPSPTGPLHIGGVRTALYNYLFARQHGGEFIFRIEDTDSGRFVPGAEEYIVESFNWLGIKFDEGVGFGGNHGPYRQSERRDIYREYVKVLLDAGKAYIAFDTPEELDAKRQEIENFQYDAKTRGMMRNSLTMPKEEVDALIASGHPYVVRFLIEPGEDVHVDDIIRGDVVINSSILDDKVLYKSADDLPTYHLANIVDDHLMEVTHVIRGEEWLPSAPLHVLLYRAFGWQDTMPRFAHLSLLLKPIGNGKLSKRDGDKLGFPVFPLEWHDPKSGEVSSGYREKGYLPEAVLNFLALLGWNPGEDGSEMLSLDDMVKLFDLSKCSKNGAKFDFVKAAWFNHQYMIRREDHEWAPEFRKVLAAEGIEATDEQMTEVVRMMKMKVIEYVDAQGNKKKRNISFASDLWPLTKFFFVAPTAFDKEDKFVKKNWKETTAEDMRQFASVLSTVDTWSVDGMKAICDPWVEESGVKPWNAWRVCLVGEGQGPDMYELAAFLGKEETLRRMNFAIETLA